MSRSEFESVLRDMHDAMPAHGCAGNCLAAVRDAFERAVQQAERAGEMRGYCQAARLKSCGHHAEAMRHRTEAEEARDKDDAPICGWCVDKHEAERRGREAGLREAADWLEYNVYAPTGNKMLRRDEDGWNQGRLQAARHFRLLLKRLERPADGEDK